MPVINTDYSTFFFFNYTATTDIYTVGNTLSLHDALPILDLLEHPQERLLRQVLRRPEISHEPEQERDDRVLIATDQHLEAQHHLPGRGRLQARHELVVGQR